MLEMGLDKLENYIEFNRSELIDDLLIIGGNFINDNTCEIIFNFKYCEELLKETPSELISTVNLLNFIISHKPNEINEEENYFKIVFTFKGN